MPFDNLPPHPAYPILADAYLKTAKSARPTRRALAQWLKRMIQAQPQRTMAILA